MLYTITAFAQTLKADCEARGLTFTLDPTTIVQLHAEGVEPTFLSVLNWCEADPNTALNSRELGSVLNTVA